MICAHIEPEFDIWDTLYHKEVLKLASEKREVDEIKKDLEKNQTFYLNGEAKGKTQVVVKQGKVASELLKVTQNNKADLLILGQEEVKTGHGTLIRNLIRRSATNVLVVPKVEFKQIKTILCAIDFSSCSDVVIQTVHEMAQHLNGQVKIKLLHLYSVPVYEEEREPPDENTIVRGKNGPVCRAFKTLTQKYSFSGISTPEYMEQTASAGTFHESIIHTAQKENADILIVGNMGHSPYKQFYLGSVAEKLTLSDLPCATWFVSCNQ